ncbi:uncharacterized protein ALTATR162_LOCUS5098 [Alternaria atra]|uniref:Uncharacterized protein n=1 Tax=Alternaria atra TaxID=119953 RepID=A0A8J2I4B1_9PLEO|nr:uncharacterized protein ALTATR162_LOCUS5098 [Alternaria atra]CAG5158474.1 unnamed protein product [Alternaria atra]
MSEAKYMRYLTAFFPSLLTLKLCLQQPRHTGLWPLPVNRLHRAAPHGSINDLTHTSSFAAPKSLAHKQDDLANGVDVADNGAMR